MSESGRCHRALVVEDDPAIRRLVAKLLARRNIEIDTATDGAKAVELIRTVPYSVIVLDLMVPEVNGFEIIDFIRKEELRSRSSPRCRNRR
jgi:DNA-binding response OmpR family regulator